MSCCIDWEEMSYIIWYDEQEAMDGTGSYEHGEHGYDDGQESTLINGKAVDVEVVICATIAEKIGGVHTPTHTLPRDYGRR